MWKHLTHPDPQIYRSNNYVVLDFEATNREGGALDPENRLLLTTWKLGCGHKEYGPRAQEKLPELGNRANYLRSSELPDTLRRAIETADFLVAQSAKYELQWLARHGIDIGRILVWDTLIAEYVRLGNRRGHLDLDSLCKRYGIRTKDRLIKLLMESGVCPSEMPFSWLKEYGIADTENTEQVFLKQREELVDFFPHIYTRCLLTPVLADIEKNGMQMDPEKVHEEFKKEDTAYNDATSRLAEKYPGINFESRPQLGVLLYDTLKFDELRDRKGEPIHTPGGARKTDGDTLAALEARTDDQRSFKAALAAIQEPSAALTFLEKMEKCCNEAGGRVYAKYNQAVTRNHRLSSSGRTYKLQFQNFPRDYKHLFKARFEDWCVAEADGMGMEFRTGVHLGRDPVGSADIRSGKDVHKTTASEMLQKPEARVTSSERQDAKPETFRPMYYSNGQTEAQRRYAKYFHTHYGTLYKVQTDWTYEVLKTKKLKTEWGLVFYWPDCKADSRTGYIKYSTEIANYPISCLATGEIIPIGLVYTWHMMRDQKMVGFITNTVHDSVIGEIPLYEIDQWRAIVEDALTAKTYFFLDKVYGMKMTVPLGVETKFGTHWSYKNYGEFKLQLEPKYDE